MSVQEVVESVRSLNRAFTRLRQLLEYTRGIVIGLERAERERDRERRTAFAGPSDYVHSRAAVAPAMTTVAGWAAELVLRAALDLLWSAPDLGDQDEHLPTAHGFDAFFGSLYHLNAEDEAEHPD